MAIYGSYEWIDTCDGSWDVYVQERKIANVRQNSGGYWFVTSNPDSTFADGLELIRMLDGSSNIGSVQSHG